MGGYASETEGAPGRPLLRSGRRIGTHAPAASPLGPKLAWMGPGHQAASTAVRNPSSSVRPNRVDPRRALGRDGEQLAADHLGRLGLSTLARNQRTRYGEIDLIAFDGRTLVFAEVKTRRVRAAAAGARPEQLPLSWLSHRQRSRLRRLAVAWLSDESRARPTAQTIRFDAIGVTVDGNDRLVAIEHVEDAW
jgi:putative endonuclease